MKLVILQVPDCPNAAVLETRLAPLLAARSDIVLARHLVTSQADAERLGMTGSPTLLADGVDPFAAAPGQPSPLPSLPPPSPPSPAASTATSTAVPPPPPPRPSSAPRCACNPAKGVGVPPSTLFGYRYATDTPREAHRGGLGWGA